MKNRLGIILSLLLFLSLDGIAFALSANASPAHSPDGIASTQKRRRTKRRVKRQNRPRTYETVVTPDEAGSGSMAPGAGAPAEPMPATGGMPPPPPPPPPPAEESPSAMPAPAAAPPSDPQDATGRGRAEPSKKSAPKIKPPTVKIKPPTR